MAGPSSTSAGHAWPASANSATCGSSTPCGRGSPLPRREPRGAWRRQLPGPQRAGATFVAMGVGGALGAMRAAPSPIAGAAHLTMAAMALSASSPPPSVSPSADHPRSPSRSRCSGASRSSRTRRSSHRGDGALPARLRGHRPHRSDLRGLRADHHLDLAHPPHSPRVGWQWASSCSLPAPPWACWPWAGCAPLRRPCAWRAGGAAAVLVKACGRV